VIQKSDCGVLDRYEHKRQQQVDVGPIMENEQLAAAVTSSQHQLSCGGAEKSHATDKGSSFQRYKPITGGINFDNNASGRLGNVCVTKPVLVCGGISLKNSRNVSRASDDARNALAKSRKDFEKRQRRTEKNKHKDERREWKKLQPLQGVNDGTKIKVESA